MRDPAPYVGRFAPSPTGPLHIGSLLAAIASYLEAKSNNGQWLLRIEDIDPPREQPGADTLIIEALEAHGFEWNGPIVFQSSSARRHRAVLEELLARRKAYRCSCSRRDLADLPRGPLGVIYPGTCRNGCQASEAAIRVLTDSRSVAIDDRLQGRYGQSLEAESGDYVIWRRDGLVAYHLAVVIDDFDQNVTEIVRGIDLLDSTPRQVYLQQLCGFTTPSYAHIPVATNPQGQKVSKSTGAAGVDNACAVRNLVSGLALLGQRPPSELNDAGLPDVWQWGLANWDLSQLAGKKTVQLGQDSMLQRENPLR